MTHVFAVGWTHRLPTPGAEGRVRTAQISGPVTHVLQRRVQSRRVRVTSPPDVRSAGMTVVTRWPMVGRRRKLDSFKIALGDEGCEGFCIYGPPGVGKTRLGDECMALAEAAGRAVLRDRGAVDQRSPVRRHRLSAPCPRLGRPELRRRARFRGPGAGVEHLGGHEVSEVVQPELAQTELRR